jgi:uncharacterized protein Yka (UPF0111/DUF47 family)
VKLSLVPKDRDYFRLISELAANLDAEAQLLVRFMYDDDSQSIAAAILEHQHVGDKIAHDIVRRLNKSFITPVDREDIYDLEAAADEVHDSIEEVRGRVLIYRVDEITSHARRQAEVIAQATLFLRECMDNLEQPKGLDERIEREHVANVIESIVLKHN